jgi:type 1 glutamine amidotransferase
VSSNEQLLSFMLRFRNLLPISLSIFVLAAGCIVGADSFGAEQPIKVLLVTGDDVSPAHNWREVSATLRGLLKDSGKFDVRVCEDAGLLDSVQSLNRYDLVLLAMYNAKTPTLSAGAKENLVKFVSGGKGLVITHLASASFKEWDEFGKLCGRHWVMGKSGHGPRGPFKTRIAKKDDPITAGLTDFEADDELYAKLQGDAPITVLVEADSDWSHQTEPLVFKVAYGQGRVFHETLGHDAKALQNPTVQTLIKRGCEWAGRGKVE